MPVEKQVAAIWVATAGHLDDLPLALVRRFEGEWLAHLDAQAPELLRSIREERQISDETRAGLATQAKAFKASFEASPAPAAGTGA